LNLTPKQRRKFRELGLLPEENKHRDAKLNYQYKQLQDPKPKKVIDILKSKKGMA
jgi:hypothetical protein